MKIRATFNVAELEDQLDDFTDKVTQVASRRALAKLRDQAQVAGLRELARVYGIGPRQFEKYVTSALATSELEASITARGSGLPVHGFSPSETRRGVSVRIKGRRVLIPHSFIARMTSGRVGVFARGSYGGKGLSGALPTGQSFGRFEYARGKRKKANNRWGSTVLPINELFTFGPAEAFGSEQVTDAMHNRVEEQFWKVMKQELRFAVGRAGR